MGNELWTSPAIGLVALIFLGLLILFLSEQEKKNSPKKEKETQLSMGVCVVGLAGIAVLALKFLS